MKTLLAVSAECIPTKTRAKCKIRREVAAIRKKERYYMKIASSLNKINLTNSNTKNHKKIQEELIDTKRIIRIHSRPNQ